MNEYCDDVAKYTAEVDTAAIAAIVKYCGISLRNADSAMVSGKSPAELTTVRDGFASKKLGLEREQAEAGLAAALEKMQGVGRKNRVTFYYLLAQATGTLGKLT